MLIFRKYISDKRVEKHYISVGAWVGDAVSYAYLGEAMGMKRKVNQWGTWEEEYAKRGYQTISLDRFVELGGYGKSLDDVLGKKRDFGESPIFHAQIYKERYLGKIESVINLDKMMQDGQPQTAWSISPSTED